MGLERSGAGEEESEEEIMAASALLPLAGMSQQPYVSELLSFTLDRLHKEPELLRVDAERIRRQMQEVAVGNYRAFVAADRALSSCREQLAAVGRHLDSMMNDIPELSAGCTKFLDSAQEILEERKINQSLLANHSTLLDLLEIPQLMDTCIRNGNYDEALDLEAFVLRLSKLHSELPVIQALAVEVKHTTQAMISHLLQKLRSNIQLPECLRIVAHLRRVGIFSETEMRLQFLRCREAWLVSILEDLDQRNAYEYLKGMVNCHRTQLFDIVNQYRAIFNNDKSGNEENYDGGLLFSWAMHQINTHLSILEAMLPKISDGGALSNILDQCMYCAMGLGLVGLDFRGLLLPLFENAVLNLFSRNVGMAVKNFEEALSSHHWVPLPAVGFTANTTNSENHDDMTPPSILMEHIPLAVFVNGVSLAINELRPCAPLSLKHALAQQIILGLQAVSEALLHYNSTRVLRQNESALFLTLCQVFLEVVCLYCATCFGRCYPGGATLIKEKRAFFDGVSQLLTGSLSKGLKKYVDHVQEDRPSAKEDVPTDIGNNEAVTMLVS